MPEAQVNDQSSGVGFLLGGKANGLGGAGGQFGLLDAAEKDAAKFIGGFVVETEVGVLFHDIECVAEFVGEFRFRCANRHRSIVAGQSIGFLPQFFHRGDLGRYLEWSKRVGLRAETLLVRQEIDLGREVWLGFRCCTSGSNHVSCLSRFVCLRRVAMMGQNSKMNFPVVLLSRISYIPSPAARQIEVCSASSETK